MTKNNEAFNTIEKDFLANRIKIDKVGFYDDPNYLQNVRVKLPIIAELLNKEC